LGTVLLCIMEVGPSPFHDKLGGVGAICNAQVAG